MMKFKEWYMDRCGTDARNWWGGMHEEFFMVIKRVMNMVAEYLDLFVAEQERKVDEAISKLENRDG